MSKTAVQSILFKKSIYSLPMVKEWIHENGFHMRKIHETKNMYRVRQFPPSPNSRYYTKRITNGIEFIIEIS